MAGINYISATGIISVGSTRHLSGCRMYKGQMATLGNNMKASGRMPTAAQGKYGAPDNAVGVKV